MLRLRATLLQLGSQLRDGLVALLLRVCHASQPFLQAGHLLLAVRQLLSHLADFGLVSVLRLSELRVSVLQSGIQNRDGLLLLLQDICRALGHDRHSPHLQLALQLLSQRMLRCSQLLALLLELRVQLGESPQLFPQRLVLLVALTRYRSECVVVSMPG